MISGYPKWRNGWFIMEYPEDRNLKWMMTRGTIYGNPSYLASSSVASWNIIETMNGLERLLCLISSVSPALASLFGQSTWVFPNFRGSNSIPKSGHSQKNGSMKAVWLSDQPISRTWTSCERVSHFYESLWIYLFYHILSYRVPLSLILSCVVSFIYFSLLFYRNVFLLQLFQHLIYILNFTVFYVIYCFKSVWSTFGRRHVSYPPYSPFLSFAVLSTLSYLSYLSYLLYPSYLCCLYPLCYL